MTGTVYSSDGSQLNYDLLPTNNFRLYFPKIPTVMFFLQDFTTPSFQVRSVDRATRYTDINEIGEKITVSNFSCNFVVDSNFKNYREVFDWMRRMTINGSTIGEVDDPVITINGQDSLRLVGAWPTSLSGISFKTNVSDIIYVTAQVEFNLDYAEFIDSPFLQPGVEI